VGFPGETEEQFEETLSLLDEVPYESLFAFKYSPRPFTKAARFTDQVEESVKSVRLERFFTKHKEMAFDLAKKYEGQELEVLVEEYDSETERCSGRSRQNKLVHFRGAGESSIGKTLRVKIREAFPQTLRGEFI
jgi:tRNA-2-methylthio-N6-dimethylallyladenosine synthase